MGQRSHGDAHQAGKRSRTEQRGQAKYLEQSHQDRTEVANRAQRMGQRSNRATGTGQRSRTEQRGWAKDRTEPPGPDRGREPSN
ncbi:hypothetical protein NDU88_006759 [Pleurodeles waltl]|uniref:Uncharacterized protein n=1 Tax=Pleurodeles waltl TaxID=8319 RepID=A0AAV7NR61_PLEWA|nr:hypothetical protein NDU88_006759 [Pleurodeles waltl]